jgi:hypothetical protein
MDSVADYDRQWEKSEGEGVDSLSEWCYGCWRRWYQLEWGEKSLDVLMSTLVSLIFMDSNVAMCCRSLCILLFFFVFVIVLSMLLRFTLLIIALVSSNFCCHGDKKCNLQHSSPWRSMTPECSLTHQVTFPPILIGKIRSVNRRSIDNTITKTKKNNRMHNDLQHITQKINDRATRTPLKPGWTHVLRKGRQFLLHMWHPSFYLCYKPGDKLWMRNYKCCCLYQYCFCM